ncbi:MAG TPA: hypothetical protein VFN27_01685 [Xanthobacteraceae bacterium]|nr:hypothetical protein [Xanthobacteraceae bacterium]
MGRSLAVIGAKAIWDGHQISFAFDPLAEIEQLVANTTFDAGSAKIIRLIFIDVGHRYGYL